MGRVKEAGCGVPPVSSFLGKTSHLFPRKVLPCLEKSLTAPPNWQRFRFCPTHKWDHRTLTRSHQLGLEFFPNLFPQLQSAAQSSTTWLWPEPAITPLPFLCSDSIFPPLQPPPAPNSLTTTLPSATKIRTPRALPWTVAASEETLLSWAMFLLSSTPCPYYSHSDRFKRQCSQIWGHTLVTQALQRQKEDCKFETRLTDLHNYRLSSETLIQKQSSDPSIPPAFGVSKILCPRGASPSSCTELEIELITRSPCSAPRHCVFSVPQIGLIPTQGKLPHVPCVGCSSPTPGLILICWVFLSTLPPWRSLP